MEEQILRSQIEKEFKRKVLFKGSLIAIAGALILTLSGLLLPPELLKIYGIPSFFLSLLLIRLGLGPYRKLTKQELHPNELIFNKKTVAYHIQNKNAFSFPITFIKSMRFYRSKKIYGIQINLGVPFSEKLLIHHPSFDVNKFHEESKEKYGCDLFFPFFYEATLHTMREYTFPLDANIKSDSQL